MTFPWCKIYNTTTLLLTQTSTARTRAPSPLAIGLCTFRSYNDKTYLSRDYDDSQRSRYALRLVVPHLTKHRWECVCYIWLRPYLQTLNDYTNKQKDNNWNSLLRHSKSRQDNKKRNKKEPRINSVSPLSQREKIMELFFSSTICAHSPKGKGGDQGTTGACRLRDQPMVREEVGGKGFGYKYL